MSLLLASSAGPVVLNSDGAPNGIIWSGATATFGSVTTINSDGAPNGIIWSGNTATFSQLISAIPGTWTWSGSTATLSQLISLLPGSWTWSGNTATLVQPTNINATTGAWNWVGNTAGIAQIVVSTVHGGHGSGDEDEVLTRWKKKKLYRAWGSGQRQVTITGLIDPDQEDMEMLIHLLSMLDD